MADKSGLADDKGWESSWVNLSKQQRKTCLHFFTPSLRVFIQIDKIPLTLPHDNLSQLSQPLLICQMLQFLDFLHGISLQCVHVSLTLDSSELGTPDTAPPVLSRGEASPRLTC